MLLTRRCVEVLGLLPTVSKLKSKLKGVSKLKTHGVQEFAIRQDEVDKHIQSLYGSARPQQMLFAESAGQLRLEAAAEEGQGAASVPAALPMPEAGPGALTGLAARLAPANGIAQPRVAQQLLAR